MVQGEQAAVWARNVVFVILCGIGLLALGANLSPAPHPPTARQLRQMEESPGLRAAVERLNGAFQRQWATAGIQPAARADELTLARRLSLALAGTIPSLEELRWFESLPSDRRLEEWLAALLTARRHHDYLAERLARAYVGTQDGPFILFRRRRFTTWLSDALVENRPYDAIVRTMI